jgi:signal transduction histidine kinase
VRRFILFLVLLSIFSTKSIGQKTDSLLKVLEGDLAQNEQIDILHNLLLEVWLNYPDKAMKYGEKALSISMELGDSVNISKSLRLMAGVHYYKADYSLSLDFNLRALEIALIIADSSLITNGYNNIGLLYYDLGSYQTALEYLLRSLSMKQKIDQTYGYATTLNNIGLVFDKVANFEEARKNFYEAYEMSVRTNNQAQEIYSQNNIGITFLKEGKFDDAMDYFRIALALAKKTENLNWGAVSLRGIGEILLNKGNYDSAEYYFDESLKSSQIIEDKKGLAEVYFLFARLYFDQNKFEQAIDYLDKSQQMAKQIRIRQQLISNLNLYTDIYKRMGDDSNTILYQERYIGLRDSLFNDVVLRNLTLVPLKIKEEEDRIRFAKQQAEIKSKDLKNTLYIVILLSTTPLIVFLIILLRKNNKKNEELRANNEELKETQSLLIRSEKMASLGVLAAGVGHEINNPLNFIKNGMSVLGMKMEEEYKGSRKVLDQYFQIINEGINRTSSIVKSLSHFSRVGVNMDEKCNIHEIIENCLVILNVKIKGRILIEKSFTNDSVTITGNEGKLYQVFMNILANAEQAISGNGKISITTERSMKSISIVIHDNGVGIEDENLVKINDPFYTTKEPGKGTGLGLFITHSIVEEHGGNVFVTSDVNLGTKFVVSFPISRTK